MYPPSAGGRGRKAIQALGGRNQRGRESPSFFCPLGLDSWLERLSGLASTTWPPWPEVTASQRAWKAGYPARVHRERGYYETRARERPVFRSYT